MPFGSHARPYKAEFIGTVEAFARGKWPFPKRSGPDFGCSFEAVRQSARELEDAHPVAGEISERPSLLRPKSCA